MAPDQAFPLLTALVFLPALGGLVVAIVGQRSDVLVPWLAALFAGMTLVLAVWVLGETGGGGLSELRAWVPAMGVSFILESDGLSSVLVVWVALSTLLTLIATLPGLRTAALVLFLETAANGIFLAQDVFLVFAFLGGVVVAVALLSSVPRNVLVFASAGLTVLFGWFVRFYQMAYAQTGFPSTELARWRSLVLYPDEERSLFLLGACGIALLVPAFVIAVDNAPRAHRLVLIATIGVIGSYLVLRLLVPLCPRGAEASSSWVLAFAALVMASAGLARGFLAHGRWLSRTRSIWAVYVPRERRRRRGAHDDSGRDWLLRSGAHDVPGARSVLRVVSHRHADRVRPRACLGRPSALGDARDAHVRDDGLPFRHPRQGIACE